MHIPTEAPTPNYFLTPGQSLGTSPKCCGTNSLLSSVNCLGCGKKFEDRTELRIQVYGMFHSGTIFGKVSFCTNIDCLEKGAVVAKRKRYHIPIFEGKIDVLESV